MKKYQIIYADPPWSYQDKQTSLGTAGFGASVRYKTMPLKDIKELPVKDLADKNCILFMWATNPLLKEGLEVIEAWGFNYRTIAFCWVKVTKNGHYISNMGRWTMGNTELCLLATKGHPKRIEKNVKQLVIAERTIHSKKPDDIRERIIQLVGDLPRIELFARPDNQLKLDGTNTFDGWDLFGNEIDNDIEL